MLTPEERKKFESVLLNPESEDAKNILASSELEALQHKPWWLKEEADAETMPQPLPVPAVLVKPPDASRPSLMYNIAEVLYVARPLFISPLIADLS